MSDFSILPVLITGLLIAVLHAAIPTHWLPFVMASRAQKWTWSKTQSILIIAGMGHVIMTTLLGALLFVLGMGVYHQVESYFILIASLSIALYGCYQIYQYKIGHKHTHCDHSHESEHHHLDELKKTSKDGWAILSLLSLLTFSPCEAFLPIYLTSVGHGWMGFVLLSLVLAVGTLVTMLSFAWLSAKTIERYKLDWLEDHEKLIMGVGLIILAIVVYFLERQHSL
ncbi:MAG: sulfite exporter TauE/SafE family protein [Bdellovibrio sp.]|nr:sulfite exporter TauE/SafE family protein [Bdellovibrio sp.]